MMMIQENTILNFQSHHQDCTHNCSISNDIPYGFRIENWKTPGGVVYITLLHRIIYSITQDIFSSGRNVPSGTIMCMMTPIVKMTRCWTHYKVIPFKNKWDWSHKQWQWQLNEYWYINIHFIWIMIYIWFLFNFKCKII